MRKTRVVVGMSGGIDSSVTALLLQQQGYDVIGVQMEYWADSSTCSASKDNSLPTSSRKLQANKCCSEESMLITRSICSFLKIPFYPLPIQDTFKSSIVDYYLDNSAKGLTPNPCSECNKEIKFGALLDFAKELGADAVATGHYARIVRNDEGLYELHEAKDNTKDQSYFLYKLSQEQLSQIILPLGNFTKDQVRRLASDAGLTAYKKSYKESQGLCFYAEKTPNGFLQRHGVPEIIQSGNIIDVSSSRVIGKHHGLAHYTIGQRRGLDIGGLSEPYFVIGKDYTNNTLTIGPKSYLYSTDAYLEEIHVHNTKLKLQGRIRYRMPKTNAILQQNADETYHAKFLSPVYAITPGQDAVFYDGTRVCLGGIIVAPK